MYALKYIQLLRIIRGPTDVNYIGFVTIVYAG